ncbi:Aggrecan core protein [Amphibalanus amphitrite]|uniref:Aggrecan core protein n=1 Tax=Amphibalanus amphitrite TaxID=1232801 RepID=A0A6A4WC78_AMPAM|nr:Aggrecan core protein [Amphibalanus amphitrite]
MSLQFATIRDRHCAQVVRTKAFCQRTEQASQSSKVWTDLGMIMGLEEDVKEHVLHKIRHTAKKYAQTMINVEPADKDGGNGLWLSWENKPGKFTWGEADATCRGLGLQLVSLDSPGKNNNINGLIGSNNIEYIWTSGRRSGGNNFVWGNGQRVGNYGWGQTGGNRRPQPDNRAGGEDCLAVLNRFYPGDGITWHDVQCHHKKPFICE